MSGQAFPEIGEVILATIEDVSSSGAWVTLDEYGGLKAYLPENEILRSMVKNKDRVLKPKQKIVVKVIKADRSKLDVDVSLKQLTQDEQRIKLIELKKSKWAESVINIAAQKLGRKNAEIETKLIAEKFDGLYNGLEHIVKEGPQLIVNLGIDQQFAEMLYKLSAERIKQPTVKISKVFEIYSQLPEGIEVVKNVLTKAKENSGSKVKIQYISAPRYRITCYANNYKEAEKNLKKIFSGIEKNVNGKGNFRVVE
ncbi:MAG: S1 RNA-binding domain-containing protein [Conexivisphaerales archaeon]